jgi:3-deoxy-D-manno-octulosonic-acid transferase
MFRRGGYGTCWWHRFGFVPKNTTRMPTIWLQAVSVGEMEALFPLLTELKHRNICIYLTTTTSTGFQIARKRYATLVKYIAYFPLDFWLFNRIAWQRIHPTLVLLMESELWPEHLHTAHKKNVKVLLINGRCSDRSFNHYKKIPRISKWLLGHVETILAASSQDRQRLITLGFPNNKIVDVGNLKVDAAIARLNTVDKNSIQREQLGMQWTHARILLGASTWPNEEKFLMELFLKAKECYPALKLILVPRHVERAHEIINLLKHYPPTYTLRSQLRKDADVCLVDTTGELNQFIRLADFVFIGKSLFPNQGGQTPIEAAVAGKPIVYGPHMQNFRAICQSLEQVEGAVRCSSEIEVQDCLLNWISQPHAAHTFGQRAQAWAQCNCGVTQRVLTYINPYFPM